MKSMLLLLLLILPATIYAQTNKVPDRKNAPASGSKQSKPAAARDAKKLPSEQKPPPVKPRPAILPSPVSPQQALPLPPAPQKNSTPEKN